MINYIIKRLLLVIPTLLGITLVTFVVISLAPGDAASFKMHSMQGQGLDTAASNKIYEQLKKQYGLDKPIPVRYVLWLKNLATLNFGNSISDGLPVISKIKERVWPTMSLALLSMVLSLGFAIPIGIYAAARQNKLFDTVSSTVLYGLYSVPSYVMAVPLILLVSVRWNWLPFQGMVSDNYAMLTTWGKVLDLVRHYILITFCFTFGAWAYYSRFVRQNMLEVLRQDYIRSARAKGLSERTVIMKHAFRNTLIPVMTMLGMILPSIIGGSVILEKMFAWPGMGRLFFDSMMSRDVPTIMALTFITACLVLLGTLLSDLSYALVDPRVKYE